MAKYRHNYTYDYEKKSRNKRFIRRLIPILIILLAGFGTYLGLDFIQEKPVLEGPYEVSKVVDGDTVEIDFNGNIERLRFIGIDCPESVHPEEEKNSPEGKMASHFTKSILEDADIYLEWDVQIRDQYCRLLAYAYLDDQKTMVNALIVAEGYATAYTVQPNSKYSDKFRKLEKEARTREKGFWA